MENKLRQFEINHSNITDILSGAFSNAFWYSIDYNQNDYDKYKQENDCFEDILAKLILNGGCINICDDDGVTHHLTKDNLMQGLEIVRNKYPNHYADFMTYNDDAITMDIIIQCAIFGKIIYA